jgi:hypothetical protein
MVAQLNTFLYDSIKKFVKIPQMISNNSLLNNFFSLYTGKNKNQETALEQEKHVPVEAAAVECNMESECI